MISGAGAQPLYAPQKIDPPPTTKSAAHKYSKIDAADENETVIKAPHMCTKISEKHIENPLSISSKYSLTLRRDMGI